MGSVKFVDGAAVVSEVQARHLLSLPDSFGVAVEGSIPEPEEPTVDPPTDNEHVAEGSELFEPKGNASLDEWRAYAIQKGIDEAELEDLKREEVKALLED